MLFVSSEIYAQQNRPAPVRFQSRNRDAFRFKSGDEVAVIAPDTAVSISESRCFSFQERFL